jgi:phosphatidylethanolamine/phosphatidyl-N-methylethanolamine N-methyltransferase
MGHPAREPRRDSARATAARQPAARPHVAVVPSRPSLASPWADKRAFLTGFLQHPREVGSVIPSSPWMERRLVRTAGLAEARTVVELGPGTGGTTRAFLRAMPADARLLAIELSPVFRDRLAQQQVDPRLIVQCGSAEQVAEFLRLHSLPAPDVVISGIPFSTMPAAVGDRIAAAVADVLPPGGRFVAYQLRPHVARFATPYLGQPERSVELLNIPPMQVFCWTKAPAGSGGHRR